MGYAEILKDPALLAEMDAMRGHRDRANYLRQAIAEKNERERRKLVIRKQETDFLAGHATESAPAGS